MPSNQTPKTARCEVLAIDLPADGAPAQNTVTLLVRRQDGRCQLVDVSAHIGAPYQPVASAPPPPPPFHS